jgi:hypothetical protein
VAPRTAVAMVNARNARCPLLMVVAEHDTMAPTGPALAVAARAPLGELYRSRGGHYDVYAGGLDHENVLRVETSFLHRHSEMPGHSHDPAAPAAMACWSNCSGQ